MIIRIVPWVLGILGAVASTCLLACYPRPHEYTQVPAISGVLLNNGKPVSGATVYLAQTGIRGENRCRRLHAAAVTNDSGGFQIAPVVKLNLFTSILNPPDVVLQMTSVCFQTSSGPAFGMSIIARTDRTTSFVASCDLATPENVFRGRVSIPGNPRGICTNRAQ